MKKLIAVGAAAALLLVSAVPVLADDDCGTQSVTVTATPTYVCIANSEATFDFGVVAASSNLKTAVAWSTITNNSTIAIDISIGCNDWDGGGGTAWTYGPAGADTAQLKASGTNGGTGGTTAAGAYDIIIPSSSSILFAKSLAAITNIAWEMQLDAPTSFSYPNAQTTTVTLTAAAS